MVNLCKMPTLNAASYDEDKIKDLEVSLKSSEQRRQHDFDAFTRAEKAWMSEVTALQSRIKELEQNVFHHADLSNKLKVELSFKDAELRSLRGF